MVRALVLTSLAITLGLVGTARAQTESEALSESATGLASPRPARARVVVVPAVGRGVDPIVAPHVTDALRTAAGSAGYDVLTEPQTIEALAALRIGSVTSPADLWRVTFVAEARRGVSASVWAERGRYVFEIVVASLDGTGPFRARGDASADELLERVAEELRRILAPASEWNAEEAERIATSATARSADAPRIVPRGPQVRGFASLRRRGPTRTDRPLSLAFQTEGAIGTSGDGFYNHLVGVRLDYHFNRSFALGAYLGYVNLRGNSGRVSNLLPYVQLEHRVHVIGEDGLSVPIRAGFGFLPYNGIFFRIAGGLNIPVGDRFELGFDLLSPTFWFTPDGRATSFDVAAELIYRFGQRGETPAQTTR